MQLQLNTALGIAIHPADAVLVPTEALLESFDLPGSHCLVLSVSDRLLDPALWPEGTARTQLGVMRYPAHQIVSLLSVVGKSVLATLLDTGKPEIHAWLCGATFPGAAVLLIGETRSRIALLKPQQIQEVLPHIEPTEPAPPALLMDAMGWLVQQFNSRDTVEKFSFGSHEVEEVLLANAKVAHAAPKLSAGMQPEAAATSPMLH